MNKLCKDKLNIRQPVTDTVGFILSAKHNFLFKHYLNTTPWWNISSQGSFKKRVEQTKPWHEHVWQGRTSSPGALRCDEDKLSELLTFGELQEQVHWNTSIMHVLVHTKGFRNNNTQQISCVQNEVCARVHTIYTSNSSRHLKGDSVISQRDRRKQTVEKERSPPERDRISLTVSFSRPGGFTWTQHTGQSVWCIHYLNVTAFTHQRCICCTFFKRCWFKYIIFSWCCHFEM